MPKFNQRAFLKEVNKSLNSKEMKNEAYKIVQNKVEEADRKMIQNFESHPVTRELDAGPDSGNLSGTLGGYGNLFSFIGFERGSNPTDIVRNFLRSGTRVYRNPRVVSNPNFVEMTFKIKSVNVDQLESMTPSPWEGRSWLRSLERGMTGLGYYIFEKSDKSRSGSAYQSSNKIRSFVFKPIKYMSSIMEKFNKDLV